MTDTRELATKATHVTFFEDRARVTRTLTATLGKGLHDLTLLGISAVIDDPSVTLTLDTDQARVLASRARRRVREQHLTSGDELAALTTQRDEHQRHHDDALLEHERACHAQRRVEGLAATLRQKLARPSLCDEPAQWQDALNTVLTELEQALERREQAQQRIERTRRDIAHTAQLIAQASHTTRSLEAVVDAQLENLTDQDLTVGITLRYFTPCALWRPEHRARLVRPDDAPATLELHTLASIWQRTGEVWEDVLCTFSTARPTQAASPPLLSDDTLHTRPKTDEERRTIQVEARDVDIQTAGPQGARKLDELPGVDDGGEPLKLTVERPVSIPSTGRAVRLELSHTSLACELETVAYPERAPTAHLRVRATWQGKEPLLAGPVTLMRESTLVGKAPMHFVAPQEVFELGFGISEGVRIRREVKSEDVSRTLSRRTRTAYTVTLRVSNMGQHTEQITIVDRVPVSELEQVEVETTQLPRAATRKEDGFIEITRALTPRYTEEMKLEYRVDCAPNVSLSL